MLRVDTTLSDDTTLRARTHSCGPWLFRNTLRRFPNSKRDWKRDLGYKFENETQIDPVVGGRSREGKRPASLSLSLSGKKKQLRGATARARAGPRRRRWSWLLRRSYRSSSTRSFR